MLLSIYLFLDSFSCSAVDCFQTLYVVKDDLELLVLSSAGITHVPTIFGVCGAGDQTAGFVHLR